MDGKELVSQINKAISEAGYKQEVYAIGPAGIPIPIQALLPVGFKAFINLVPTNDNQSNRIGNIHQIERPAGNGSGPE